MTIICLLAASLTLDYATPAGCWNEALPLGNGRLGAMVFGGAGMERIQLNEDTLWAGGPNNALEPRMRDVLPEARRRILSGEAEEAYEWLANRDFGTSKNGNSFAYQTLGSLMMKFEGHDFPRNYRRTLSLDEAIATTSYEVDGVKFSREVFTSLADDVVVVRLMASRKGAISFTAFFESPFQRAANATNFVGKADLVLTGNASPMFDTPGMVRYYARLQPELKGGTAEADNGVLVVRGADEVTLRIAAATSFRNWKDATGVSAEEKADGALERAAASATRHARRPASILRITLAPPQTRRSSTPLGRTTPDG